MFLKDLVGGTIEILTSVKIVVVVRRGSAAMYL